MFRALGAWAFTGAYWISLAVLYAASLGRMRPGFTQAAMRRWGLTTLRILGVRIERVTPSTIEEPAARVVVCNHQSTLDMMWNAAIVAPAPLVIGKKELVWIPFVNVAWWMFDFIYIDRKNARKALVALKGVARKVVEEKRSLIMMPEGTRSPDGNLLPFKNGAFRLAIEAQVPIHPIVVSGASDLLPKGGLTAKQGTIRLTYLPPVETAGLAIKDADALAERVRAMMLAAL